MNLRAVLVVWLAVAPLARAADATTIYLTQGTSGEASFSDFALPDAIVVDLDLYQPSTHQIEGVRQTFAQTIAITAQLEAARLAREEGYAEKRAQAALRGAPRVAADPDPEYRQVASVAPGYFFAYRHPHDRPHVRPHTRPPGSREPMSEEPVLSKSFGKPLRSSDRRPGR